MCCLIFTQFQYLQFIEMTKFKFFRITDGSVYKKIWLYTVYNI